MAIQAWLAYALALALALAATAPWALAWAASAPWALAMEAMALASEVMAVASEFMAVTLEAMDTAQAMVVAVSVPLAAGFMDSLGSTKLQSTDSTSGVKQIFLHIGSGNGHS